MSSAVVAVIILVLIIIVIFVAVRLAALEECLTGVWVGSPDYLKTSGLSKFYLYLAPSDIEFMWMLRGVDRPGYLVMVKDDGTIICNQFIRLRYGAAAQVWSAARALLAKKHLYIVSGARLEFTDGDAMTSLAGEGDGTTDIGDDGPLPADINISYDTVHGAMSLYDDSGVFGYLYKDGWLSSTAEDEYAQLEE